MDLEGTNFIVAPPHGLEGGVVVAQLALTAQEVLTLKDSHAAFSVVLQSKYISQSVQSDIQTSQARSGRVEGQVELTAQAMGLKEVSLSM